MIDLSCNIRICAEVSFVLSQFMRLTDGRINRQTDRQMAETNSSSKDRGCIAAAR